MFDNYLHHFISVIHPIFVDCIILEHVISCSYLLVKYCSRNPACNNQLAITAALSCLTRFKLAVVSVLDLALTFPFPAVGRADYPGFNKEFGFCNKPHF